MVLPSLERLPAEAAVDRENARRLGIRSNLTLPLAVGAKLPSALSPSTPFSGDRDWPDALVRRLQLVAQVFTNALARRRHDLDLRESRGAPRAWPPTPPRPDSGPSTSRTGVFWATERTRAIFGYSPDETLDMARFEASVASRRLGRVREAIERAARTGEPVDVEYRIVHPGDEPRALDRLAWAAPTVERRAASRTPDGLSASTSPSGRSPRRRFA